ncbi:gram domain-containing protein 3-like isoform x1 protein [Lasius niger]|uniref:Gram domain-containing protein 3-like isoform x1 protein n=1 Tax=Lasius niger TaxID=67767 RepID=A0A0J7KYH0_LASNI|nr:gram domain-containing protein 3-like isoform x1 protein [Lasius niger]
MHGGSFCFRPRGGIGSEQPPSSDSDDYTTAHHQGSVGYGQSLDVYTVPKVQVSGPPNADESASVINGEE